MPFDWEGRWQEPSQTEVAEWLNRLVNPEDTQVPVEMPEHIQQKLMEMSSGARQYETTAHLNETSYQSVASCAAQGRVAVVLPVYGALHLVKQCIAAIQKHTTYPYTLVPVDDESSDPEVWEYLKTTSHAAMRNKKNRGFAATVNRGIRAAMQDPNITHVCVLNSDVIVTPHWLTKMMMALEADPRHVIVNPATNNTALINVPLQSGRSFLDMSRAFERKSERKYPEIMPTGFCFLFRKNLIDSIGYFDEAYGSYGEETDFWFRAINQKGEDGRFLFNKAVMADDAYVFHERGSSFSALSTEEHSGHRKSGSERFHKLHPGFRDWRANYNPQSVLQEVRADVPAELFQTDYTYRVAWVVKSAAWCGGMKYIADVVNTMLDRGVDAKVCVVKQHPQQGEVVLPDLRTAPIFFEDEEDFLVNFTERVFTNGIVVAAVGEMIKPVSVLASQVETLMPVHHVQSYDPDLTTNLEMKRYMAQCYGKLPFTISSSSWISDLLAKEYELPRPLTVEPGIEKNLFHSDGTEREDGDSRKTVLVLLDPQYPFRGYHRGVQYCKELLAQAGKAADLRIFGLGVEAVPECPGIHCLGKLPQQRLAQLLRTEVDILVDPSLSHSYGLPAAEARASGVTVLSWDNKGIRSVKDEYTHIFHNNVSAKAAAEFTIKTAFKQHIRVPNHSILSREESVNRFIQQFERMLGLTTFKKKIVVVTPHARKHGGPTTIINLANVLKHLGQDVKLLSIYDDFNPEVIGFSHVPIYVGAENMPECDLLIINSDNPFIEQLINQPGAKNAKKVMFKLSHNPRFKAIEEAALRMPMWDRIVTSTPHLAQQAMKQEEGWRHIEWPPEKVRPLGWYHYTFPVFNTPPDKREYGSVESVLRVGILIHNHPAKGTREAMAACEALKRKYGANVHIIGIGEVNLQNAPQWLQYIQSPNRMQMAEIMSQLDVWLGASHSEGLGRMALEAMSAGCAVVTTNTGAEFLKDGDNCLLYPAGDPQSGGRAVDRLAQDRELFKRLVVNGYNTAVDSADPKAYLDNVGRMLTEVFDG